MTQPEINKKIVYVTLVDLLARVNNANEDLSFNTISDKERMRDAHWLANKVMGHALTILHLLDDANVQSLVTLQPFKLIFVVSASIDVLTRAAMEAFLVFHYVFYAPTTMEEKNYRYWVYRAAGIAERQNLPETAYAHKQTKAEDKKELDKLHDKLKSNAVFQSLTTKQKTRFFEGKERNLWRWKPDVKKVLSWSDIAIDAGFSKMLASHIYRYLSGSAHSSSLSILRMAQALINKEPEKLIQGSINTMNIVIANMIREYCALFPRAQDVLTKDLEGSNLVKQYIQIGRELDKYMGT